MNKTPGLYKPRMDGGAKGSILRKKEACLGEIGKRRDSWRKRGLRQRCGSWWTKGLVTICICGNKEDYKYSCLLLSFFYDGLKSIFT